MATLNLGKYKAGLRINHIFSLFSQKNKIFYLLKKKENESRMAEEKRIADRKRNLIILIEKYLLTMGYVDSVMKLQAESTISLDK